MAPTCHKLQSISAMRVVAASPGLNARIEIDRAALGEGVSRARSGNPHHRFNRGVIGRRRDRRARLGDGRGETGGALGLGDREPLAGRNADEGDANLGNDARAVERSDLSEGRESLDGFHRLSFPRGDESDGEARALDERDGGRTGASRPEATGDGNIRSGSTHSAGQGL